MSSPLQLSLCCGNYDIHQGLIHGSVKPQGIDLTTLVYPTPPRQWRMDTHSEFDICEFSMSSYLITYDRQTTGGRVQMEPVMAIPVFPHRRFRHSFIFVNSDAGIDSPSDLAGRKVGLRTWQATAGLWARGILQDEYGVDLRSIKWFTSDVEAIPADPPEGFDLQRIPEDQSVTDLLVEGKLDALVYPEMPAQLLDGDPRIRRLFPDYKAEEIAYFKKTGNFPIMHTVVIKQSLLDKHPWVAREMLLAFRESKDQAFRKMRDPRSISLAWVRELIDEQQAVLGKDPWAHSVADNVHNIETMIRYSLDQGMISRPISVEELFFPSTLGEMPQYH